MPVGAKQNWLNQQTLISTDVSLKYSFTRSRRGLFVNVASKLFDEREDGYYYQHINETPNLSVALGVKHYYIALEKEKNDVDLAIRLYTLGHFENNPTKLKDVDEVFGAKNGIIEY